MLNTIRIYRMVTGMFANKIKILMAIYSRYLGNTMKW